MTPDSRPADRVPGGSPRRRSPACRSTTGPCSRPPTSTSAPSRPSAWPSWPASTPPRSARTSPTSARTAPGASGYDVEFLLHQISRELGLTHDWPVVIVGVGNLGHALANYRGFGARGFRIVALVDADPAKVGPASRRPGGRGARRPSPRSSPTARSRSASSPRPAGAAQEVADRLVDAGVTSILNFAPAVVTRPGGRVAAQGRPRDRAADPVLLPAAQGAARRRQRARRHRDRGRDDGQGAKADDHRAARAAPATR